MREWAETNMAGTANTLEDVTCVRRVGNEYDCVLEITTTAGLVTVRGTATCDDECLWRLDDADLP